MMECGISEKVNHSYIHPSYLENKTYEHWKGRKRCLMFNWIVTHLMWNNLSFTVIFLLILPFPDTSPAHQVDYNHYKDGNCEHNHDDQAN